MLDQLNAVNKKKIYHVNDLEFAKFGRILPYRMSEQSEAFVAKQNLQNKASYVVHEEQLANDACIATLKKEVFGEMPIQVGLVYGRNEALTGIEYHLGSEVNYAFEDCVLLLAEAKQWKEEGISIDQLQAFYVPKHTMIELYSNVLHYTPIEVDKQGMAMLVVLLEGTNTEIEYEEGSLLIKKNKWYACHASQSQKIALGYRVGLLGEMFVLNKI